MKPLVKKQTVQSNGIQKSVSFGIKTSGLHHILGILRNQLYSDKIMAVVREYSCNAVDATIESSDKYGTDPNRAIEVTIPNKMNPNFKVRDYGVALSESEVQDVYAFYGESTKRNTNNQIGMLGIGSKSAFAYGDNFVINSYIDGKKNIYNAFIDETQVGQISKIGTEDTNEENGIEIVVPVREGDEQEFADKAKSLFQHFPVRPIIHGVPQFQYKTDEVLYSGEGWKWLNVSYERYHNSGEATVVMGNIGYPIDRSSLNLSYDSNVSSLLSENLILEVPIGDLEISASREQLQYTDHTRQKLVEKLEKIAGELADVVSESFKDAETLFDAKCLYGSTFDYGSPLYALREVIAKKLVWKGKPVNSNDYSIYGHDGVVLHKFSKSHRGLQRWKPEGHSRIDCDARTVVIENDLGHRRGLMGRVLGLILEQDKRPFLIQFDDAKARKKFIKEESFDAKMVKLSSLQARKLKEFGYTNSNGSSGTYENKNPKHTSKAFSLNMEKIKKYASARSDYFNSENVDTENDKGLYVIIDRFFIEGIKEGQAVERSTADWRYQGEVEPRHIEGVAGQLEAIGIDMPKVYAFKTAMRGKVEDKENWTNFWDWLQEKVSEEIENQNLTQKYINRQHALSVRDEFLWDKNMGAKAQSAILHGLVSEDSLYADFHSKKEQMLHHSDKKAIDSLREVSKSFGIVHDIEETKPTFNLRRLGKKVEEKYGMLRHAVGDRYRYNDVEKDMQKDIVNYINVIDICNLKGGEKS